MHRGCIIHQPCIFDDKYSSTIHRQKKNHGDIHESLQSRQRCLMRAQLPCCRLVKGITRWTRRLRRWLRLRHRLAFPFWNSVTRPRVGACRQPCFGLRSLDRAWLQSRRRSDWVQGWMFWLLDRAWLKSRHRSGWILGSGTVLGELPPRQQVSLMMECEVSS